MTWQIIFITGSGGYMLRQKHLDTTWAQKIAYTHDRILIELMTFQRHVEDYILCYTLSIDLLRSLILNIWLHSEFCDNAYREL